MPIIEKKFAGSSAGGWYIGIEWNVNSQSVSNNSSNVTVTMFLRTQGSQYWIESKPAKKVSLSINGTTYSSTSTVGIGANTRKNLFSKTVDIPHNGDGTKTCSFSCSGVFGLTLTGKYYGTVSHSGSGAFPTINLNTAPWWTSNDTRMNDIRDHVIVPENLGGVTITSSTGWDNEQGGNIHYDLHRYVNDQYSGQIKWGGNDANASDNISGWGQGTRFKWEAKLHDGQGLWASESRWSWVYTKNVFTRASVDTISSIYHDTIDLTFIARTARNSGGGNGHVNTSFGYRIESLTPGVNIHGNNTHSTNTHSDVHFSLGIKKPNHNPSQPHYLDYNELKNALRGSNFVGNIRLRLVSWNSYGSSGSYDFNVYVDLRANPAWTTITYSNDNKISHNGSEYYIPAYLPFKFSWNAVYDPVDNQPCTYEVMYQIGSQGYVYLGSTSSTSYTAYLGSTAIGNNKINDFRIIVRALTSYGTVSDSGGTRITLWDYSIPTVKVETIDRKKDSVVLAGTITTNSSIPSINPTSTHWRWNSGGPNTNNVMFTSTGSGVTRNFSLTISASQSASGQIHVASSDAVRDLIVGKNIDVPWGNTNVNIKAYMPVMSLTKNGLGINTKPISGYKFSVEGDSKINGTLVPKNLIVQGYPTNNTSGSYAGQWTKIATLKVTQRYGNVAAELGFLGNGNGGTSLQSGRIVVRLKQQEPLGEAPKCALYLHNATSTDPSCFKLIITQNNSSATVGELWFRNGISYDQVFFYQITTNHSSSSLTMHELSGYTTSLPQGTQIHCSSTVITNSDLATSSNYKGKVANIGTDGVMEVGKYIDFHDNSTNDYDVRLQCLGNRLNVHGAMSIEQQLEIRHYIGLPNNGGGWLHGASNGNIRAHKQSAEAFHSIISQTTVSDHKVALGGLGNAFGFFLYDANRTANGYDREMTFDLSTKNLYTSCRTIFNEWVYIQGNHGLYFPDHNGGWYMQDSTWLRSYADKNIYTGGEMQCNRVATRHVNALGGQNIDINSFGNAIALNCGSQSGIYVDFKPQWSGSKGTEPSFFNTTGAGWGYIGGSGHYWFRIYGSGGSVSDRNKKYHITKADCSEQYENVKALNLYNYRSVSDKVNKETGEIEEKVYRQDLMLGTMVDELPTETVFYDNESGDGKAVDMYSYTSMILGATKHLIEKVEDLELQLEKMEELLDGITNER